VRGNFLGSCHPTGCQRSIWTPNHGTFQLQKRNTVKRTTSRIGCFHQFPCVAIVGEGREWRTLPSPVSRTARREMSPKLRALGLTCQPQDLSIAIVFQQVVVHVVAKPIHALRGTVVLHKLRERAELMAQLVKYVEGPDLVRRLQACMKAPLRLTLRKTISPSTEAAKLPGPRS
jgi:hypothetical protein